VSETSHYLCVGCPLGCRLEVDSVGDDIVEVRGHSCKRGEVFARQEHVDPRRFVTTTVAIRGAAWPRLPVATNDQVPKPLMRDVCRALHELRLEAPVALGEVVLADALGTGIDVVATRSLERA
jgi:CxxC motif-containing protein